MGDKRKIETKKCAFSIKGFCADWEKLLTKMRANLMRTQNEKMGRNPELVPAQSREVIVLPTCLRAQAVRSSSCRKSCPAYSKLQSGT